MSPFAYKTNVKIDSFPVNHNDIALIIKSLASNKAHGSDNISIKVIYIYSESIALPPKLLFETVLKEKKILNRWKCAQKTGKIFVKKLLSYQLTSYLQQNI